MFKCLIRQAIPQWYINGVPMPFSLPLVIYMARTWEIIAKFMKTACQNTVGGIKGLFDSITMMAINVNIKHPGKYTKQFQNRKYDIIDVTKSGCLTLFGVVKATCPIDGNVGCSVIQFLSGTFGTVQTTVRFLISPENSPTEPPAEIEQNSNRPSKAGLSSPVRTVTDQFNRLDAQKR